MRVVISHFYNEEYMLPWWLRHHREIFDHGVLIDYHSTDQSRAICSELVPHWEVVPSENSEFAAIMVDFEVMKHEQRFANAWKMALNTTEFLQGDIAAVENRIQSTSSTAARLEAALLVDDEPDNLPSHEFPLVRQKFSGIWERDLKYFGGIRLRDMVRGTAIARLMDRTSRYGLVNRTAVTGQRLTCRGRIYHRYKIGAYSPGRHRSALPGQLSIDRDIASIWWYGFSPWNEHVLARKLQIDGRRDNFDKAHQFGIQHSAKAEELNRSWRSAREICQPLSSR